MQKNENGRSMVEMMAVLAIIGVISVTGIKGFSMAMNKLRANSIAEFVAAASIYAQSHNVRIQDLAELTEDYDETAPECVTAIDATTDGKVKLTFENTTKCATIMKLVENTFGKCRWVSDDNNHQGTFKPTDSWNPTRNECE